MNAPLSPPAEVHLALPVGQRVVVAKRGLAILALLILMIWMDLRYPSASLLPLMFMAMLAQDIVERVRILRRPTYALNEQGITFSASKHHMPTLLAWSEIQEAHCSRQGKLSLYTRGREKVVVISPLHEHYVDAIMVLRVNLAPLWRKMRQSVYDRTGWAYLNLLVPLTLVGGGIGVAVLPKENFIAFIMIGTALFFAHHQVKAVRRIEFTDDGIEVKTLFGRERITAADITNIGLEPDRTYGRSGYVLLVINNNRTIHLDGFPLDPIFLYFVFSVWHHDQMIVNP